MKKSVILLVVISIILFSNFVYAANLNLKITGNIGNLTSDLILKTNPSSGSGVDAYDMRTTSNPDTYSQFYSTSTGTNLAIDTWKTNPRTVNLVYHMSTAQTGTLALSWSSLSSTSYAATLTDYGTDGTYTTSSGSSDMRASSSYSKTITGSSDIYFKVAVTDYTAPTTKVTTTTTSGGGGGGAEAVFPKLSGLIAVPNSLTLPATVNIESSGKISLTNTGNSSIEVDASLTELEKIIKLKKNSFIIDAGATEIFEFSILTDEPGIYAGKINFISEGKAIEIPVSLNVKSESPLFDIKLDVASMTIKPGDKLAGQITLVQAGLQEKVDVQINYMIKDFNGKTYFQKSETIAVDREKSYLYEFPTQDLPAGDYLIGSEVIYSGGVATASSHFSIKESGFNNIYLLVILIAASLLLISIVLIYRKTKRIKGRSPK